MLIPIVEAIEELGIIESGRIYDQVRGTLNRKQYCQIIRFLLVKGFITVSSNDVLTWTGPAKSTRNPLTRAG